MKILVPISGDVVAKLMHRHPVLKKEKEGKTKQTEHLFSYLSSRDLTLSLSPPKHTNFLFSLILLTLTYLLAVSFDINAIRDAK